MNEYFFNSPRAADAVLTMLAFRGFDAMRVQNVIETHATTVQVELACRAAGVPLQGRELSRCPVCSEVLTHVGCDRCAGDAWFRATEGMNAVHAEALELNAERDAEDAQELDEVHVCEECGDDEFTNGSCDGCGRFDSRLDDDEREELRQGLCDGRDARAHGDYPEE